GCQPAGLADSQRSPDSSLISKPTARRFAFTVSFFKRPISLPNLGRFYSIAPAAELDALPTRSRRPPTPHVMNALLITLIVTLPIIGVSVLIWLWVRRSPTPAVAARRRMLLYSLWIAFGITGWLRGPIARSHVYRSVVGISTVAFANDSGTPLHEVEVMMRAADGGTHTYRFSSLRAGRRERLAVRTSDLVL